jgi:glutathione synthase/RimK-type ligase-like ATP-grasp enzyme
MQGFIFKTIDLEDSMIIVMAEDQDPHADMVIRAIESKGGDVLRVNPELLDERLNGISCQLDQEGNLGGSFKYLNRQADIPSINSVFCRNYHFQFAEDGENKSADDLLIAKELEASFKGLCESLSCNWMNAPWYMDACESKIVQMQAARRLGFDVPDMLLTNQAEPLLEFKSSQEVVVKQLSGICVFEEDGVSAKSLYTHLLKNDDLKNLSELQHSPAFFNSFIDKQHDLRVTVVGERIFSVRIFSQQFAESQIDFRRREGDWEMEVCELPEELVDKIMKLMQHFHLNFGAIDFAVDTEGRFWFLEINSEGNWLWMESALEVPICAAIASQLLEC